MTEPSRVSCGRNGGNCQCTSVEECFYERSSPANAEPRCVEGRENLLLISHEIKEARNAYLDGLGQFGSAERREKLIQVLFDDAATIASTLEYFATQQAAMPVNADLLALADELIDWRNICTQNSSGGDGEFRVECSSGSDAQARALRSVLKRASDALRIRAQSTREPEISVSVLEKLSSTEEMDIDFLLNSLVDPKVDPTFNRGIVAGFRRQLIKVAAAEAALLAPTSPECRPLNDEELADLHMDAMETSRIMKDLLTSPERHDPRTGPCPSCGFHIKHMGRGKPGRFIEDDDELTSPECSPTDARFIKGRILTNDGGPDDVDHGVCPECKGERVVEVETQPITMEDFHPDKNLPGCMMPDGGDCCAGHAAVVEDWHKQRREIERLRAIQPRNDRTPHERDS
jgi:ssDNA-binding Zn-finger/Zn-ribbon topoisomerase 1